jgi:hypothetical protein
MSTELNCNINPNREKKIYLKDFIYLLIESTLETGDVNYVIVLVFQNKSISFGHTDYNQGLTIIEVYNNGKITIPNYTFDEIVNMKQWNINDISKYNFLITDKI